MRLKKKIALVVPWFGRHCHGGAETLAAQLAGHLKNEGPDVTVLTTTVRDFTGNWNENFYRPGYCREKGLPIKRFKAHSGSHRIFQTLVRKINAGVPINESQEKTFIENSVRSLEMEKYLRENTANYDWFIFVPYLYGTTFWGIEAVPEKSILIGCLHDEPYAHLKIFRRMYQNARALVYLSRPEKELAEKLYGVAGKPSLIGGALEVPPAGEAGIFRKKFKISDNFLLYSGRQEEGKNVPLLINYFLRFKKENPSGLKLVLIGPGTGTARYTNSGEVIDSGLVSGADKLNAMAAASFLIQPSVHESFSIVIMESWLNRRPVAVHANCLVTRDFVAQSGGGLYFSNYLEFQEVINYFLKNPSAAVRMAEAGRDFVLKNLLWEKVIKDYLKFFEEISL